LTLKLFHDVQEVVVHVWPVRKLDLDGIQVGKRVGHVQLPLFAVSISFALTDLASLDEGRRAVHGHVLGRGSRLEL
jgi:hypothetical protein